MPRHSNLGRSKSIQDAYTVASSYSGLDFLVPAAPPRAINKRLGRHRYNTQDLLPRSPENVYESFFFHVLARASTCNAHKSSNISCRPGRHGQHCEQRKYFSTTVKVSGTTDRDSHLREVDRERNYAIPEQTGSTRFQPRDGSIRGQDRGTYQTASRGSRNRMLQWLHKGHELPIAVVNSWFPPKFFDNTFERKFAESSTLPLNFFEDVNALRAKVIDPTKHDDHQTQGVYTKSDDGNLHDRNVRTGDSAKNGNTRALEERLKLLKSVQELEEKLAIAKKQLSHSLDHSKRSSTSEVPSLTKDKPSVILSKEDYMNLVDLYYHSYNSRFSPEATDSSPTPTFLDDFSFQLSGDFTEAGAHSLNEDENYESPLKKIHETLKSQKLKEISIMQLFVDLLLDDHSSNRALYEAYQGLPKPGVRYLPHGVIRLFMQRMSTPWTHSEKSMLRYLALIDDMQKEKIPITSAEWSSAVYLAGRSFARVTDGDLASSFRIWQQMEHEAGVKSSHVTFNILFDIAVRAGKFALAETILKEMSNRNLRLNRLGRVSLIYYHGLRGDGDGVRKSYRDLVEAGEIVDTLVLNCVIASLLNAKEPAAAEQVYERMKSMYSRLRKETRDDGTEVHYMRYPPPGESTIDREMASNHLGRVLLGAPRLQKLLPEHHQELQSLMPLVPDFTTFRSMFAYHATISGDLDRMTVLVQEMTETFGMPLRSLVFQLLFKGFALHGPTGGPHGVWSTKRLELCWNAFRDAVKDARLWRTSHSGLTRPQPMPVLPTITQINAVRIDTSSPSNPPLHDPQPRNRLLSWNNFVLDLSIFPRERHDRIERFHAQTFEDIRTSKSQGSNQQHRFSSPFFQSTVYHAPEPKLDHEEGEYVLPSPSETVKYQPYPRPDPPSVIRGEIDEEDNFDTEARSYHDEEDSADSQAPGRLTHDEFDRQHQYQVTPTRPLVCWLLRAYARNTKSRAKVEEIWGTVRRMWRPRDATERESVIRVLRRCLRDCDREGTG